MPSQGWLEKPWECESIKRARALPDSVQQWQTRSGHIGSDSDKAAEALRGHNRRMGWQRLWGVSGNLSKGQA